jgi:hypothetical protein
LRGKLTIGTPAPHNPKRFPVACSGFNPKAVVDDEYPAGSGHCTCNPFNCGFFQEAGYILKLRCMDYAFLKIKQPEYC